MPAPAPPWAAPPSAVHPAPTHPTINPRCHLCTQHLLGSASTPSAVTQPALCSAARSSKTLPGLCQAQHASWQTVVQSAMQTVESDLGRLLIIFDLTPLHMHLCHPVTLLVEVCAGDDIRIPAWCSSQTLVPLFCLQSTSSICTTRICYPRCCEGSFANNPRTGRLKLP